MASRYNHEISTAVFGPFKVLLMHVAEYLSDLPGCRFDSPSINTVTEQIPATLLHLNMTNIQGVSELSFTEPVFLFRMADLKRIALPANRVAVSLKKRGKLPFHVPATVV